MSASKLIINPEWEHAQFVSIVELKQCEQKLEVAYERIKRLEAFVNRFLSPEDLGYCVNECMRDEAREALGMERVIRK